MTIFSVPDIRRSVRGFRQPVNAGEFCGANLLIMGGDLAGQQLAPPLPVTPPLAADGQRFR